MHDVFISYSNKDKDTAMRICHYLESNNIRCWYAPRNIEPGREWPSEIVNAIRSAKIFLLISSQNSNASKHVMSEIAQASETNCTIIPFMIDNAPISDSMSYYLKSLHWLNCSGMPFEHALITLHKRVFDALHGPTPPPPPPPPPSPSVKKIIIAAIIAVILIVGGIFSVRLISGKDSPAPVPKTQDIKLYNISSLDGYRYPFYDSFMFSSDLDMFFLENTETDTLSLIKTDTGYPLKNNIDLKIESYPQIITSTNINSDFYYFYDFSNHNIQIYDSKNSSWVASYSIKNEVAEDEYIYNIMSHNNDVSGSNNCSDEIALLLCNTDGTLLTKSVYLWPDGKYSVSDISQYNIATTICGIDIPDSYLILAANSKNKPVLLDVQKGELLDIPYSEIKEKYAPHFTGGSWNLSPDKKYYTVTRQNPDNTTKVTVWNIETGKSVFTNVSRKDAFFHYANDNTLLYYTAESNTLVSYDLASGHSTILLMESYFEENEDFISVPYSFSYIAEYDMYSFSCRTENGDGSYSDQFVLTDNKGNVLYKSQIFDVEYSEYMTTFFMDNKRVIYIISTEDFSGLDEDMSMTTTIYRALYTENKDKTLNFSEDAKQ